MSNPTDVAAIPHASSFLYCLLGSAPSVAADILRANPETRADLHRAIYESRPQGETYDAMMARLLPNGLPMSSPIAAPAVAVGATLRHQDGRTGAFVCIEEDGRYRVQSLKGKGFWVFHPDDCEQIEGLAPAPSSLAGGEDERMKIGCVIANFHMLDMLTDSDPVVSIGAANALAERILAIRARSSAPEAREGEASPQGVTFDLIQHLHRQREFSERTFGPGARMAGVVDHIRKELREIEAAPADIGEWIDVVLLALDGAWRSGASPEAIAAALLMKQTRNEGRTWPDWRTADPTKAIEHDRSDEGADTAEMPEVAQARYIELLRAEEGDCITIICNNPEAADAAQSVAIDCNGAWTDWNDRRFHGESVLQCLAIAVAARESAQKEGGQA